MALDVGRSEIDVDGLLYDFHMLVKPESINPPIPYKVVVELGGFAPIATAHELYQDIAKKYAGLEYFPDDTSFINVFFSKDKPDLKLFKITLDWVEFVMSRRISILNLDSTVAEVYDYLWWDIGLSGLDKDLHRAYYSFLLKVYLVTTIEAFLADITRLPCYSDYTWLKEDDAQGAEELDADRVYVVYE